MEKVMAMFPDRVEVDREVVSLEEWATGPGTEELVKSAISKKLNKVIAGYSAFARFSKSMDYEHTPF